MATAHESVKQAPVSIAIAVDTKTDTIHYVETGAAATQNMALAAHSLGIGTFWIGVANTASEPKIRKILGLSPSHRVVSILPIGYPAESPIKERKELSELVTSQRSKRS